MSYDPGKMRNYMASLKRTMDKLWFGLDVSNRSQYPNCLTGEYLISGNAASNGVVNLIGSDVNDQIVHPMQAAIPLTAAQIISLHTAPVPLIAAPTTAYALIVNRLVLELNLTATAFTGGGAVFAVYHGQTTQLTASIAATVVKGGAGQAVYAAGSVSGAGGTNSLALLAATGIDLYADTANFAAGTGTGKVFVDYTIVTL